MNIDGLLGTRDLDIHAIVVVPRQGRLLFHVDTSTVQPIENGGHLSHPTAKHGRVGGCHQVPSHKLSSGNG